MNKKRRFSLIAFTFGMLAFVLSGSVIAQRSEVRNTKPVGIQRDALVSTTLVISQAYGGGGGSTGTYLHDYVEIKNISATPQSLNGLSLMYGSGTGQFASTAPNAFALPDVTLQPGQYFLVQTSAAGSGGTAFPVEADVTTSNLSMSGTTGKVALVITASFPTNTCGGTASPCILPHAGIVDLVSWGGANNAEGGTSTNGGSAITATQGNVRKDGGCTDTDNNNSDFDIITAPVPRNSSSSYTACGGSSGPTPNGPVDLDGDGYTDFAVIRNTDGSPSGPAVWYYNFNPANPSSGGPTQAVAWGLSSDHFLSGDFDGDGKDDVAIWREGPEAKFYILNSSNFTARVEQFGTEGDYAGVVDDYNGDGVTDLAVYRPGLGSSDQSYWFYRTTPGGPVYYVPWGAGSDFPAPGDFDGDGYADFTVQRPSGGNGVFWTLYNVEGNPATPTNVVFFGGPNDYIATGDYDGDGKTDHAILRSVGGTIQWWVRPSSDPLNAVAYVWGVSTTDWPVPGDYDGDGKYDPAIWRNGTFWVLTSSSGYTNFTTFGLGTAGDYPVANFRVF